MKPLRRHQLVWLDEFGWYRVLARASSSSDPAPAPKPQALACLEHWAQQRLPLVVTRQPAAPVADREGAALALGLPAPARWGRRPISVLASARDVTRQAEFPLAVELGSFLPEAAQPGWQLLVESLARQGVVARVYGSHGWQQITGLDYVHPASDIDLLLAVATAAQADQACELLSAAPGPMRIDGELAFEDGASVAWREWLRFRGGQTALILVKRVAGTTLEDAAAWTAKA